MEIFYPQPVPATHPHLLRTGEVYCPYSLLYIHQMQANDGKLFLFIIGYSVDHSRGIQREETESHEQHLADK